MVYTVRFGAPAGTPPGNNLVSVPLAVDSYDPPVAFATTTTIVVSNAYFGNDPAPNYVKELDIALITPGSN